MTVTLPAAEATQKALYGVLSADPTLAGLGVGVYDAVTVGAAFPYIVIGDAVEQASNRIGKTARIVTATIHAYSRTGQDFTTAGYLTVYRIVGQLDVLLDNVSLPPTDGWTFDAIDQQQHNYVRDPDGITRHCAAMYRLIMEWT